MSYYMGDFYMGDPGFGGVLARLGKAAAGFFPGGGVVARELERVTAPLARRAGGGIVKRGVEAAGQLAMRHPRATMAAGAAASTAVAVGVGGAVRRAIGTRREARGRAAGMAPRRRRMNVYNPKALRRAVRRAMGFAHMAKRVLRFVSPRAPKGRAVFKFRRKKKVC